MFKFNQFLEISYQNFKKRIGEMGDLFPCSLANNDDEVPVNQVLEQIIWD